MDSSNTEKL